MEFYTDDRSVLTSWRWAVLMGGNSRTYKFALADALLHFAREGREAVALSELAARYTVRLVEQSVAAPQGPQDGEALGPNDFLRLVQEESEQVLATGHPTDRLLAAAVANVPAMVMQKFHNVPGGDLAHRFYEMRGRGQQREVVLSPAMRTLASHEQAPLLDAELSGRWSIVQTSFAAGVGSSLIRDGVLVDLDTNIVSDVTRRRAVTGVHQAVVGFQKGRCIICGEELGVEKTAIEHTFPFACMKRAKQAGWIWRGPDIDAIWNLGPAHHRCNGSKLAGWPSPAQQARLADRNAAIAFSPHPLRATLRGTLRRAGIQGNGSAAWMKLFSELRP